MEVNIDEKLDESIRQGMQSEGKVLYGAKAMLAVCRRKDELKNNAFKPYVKCMVEQKGKEPRKYIRDQGEWLQAGLPALHLSHANRPWALWLKDIIHSQGVL